MKILVADDDEDILDVISIILSDEGFDVSKADSPEQLSKLDYDLPDLILLDIWLSGADGREICKELKTQKHTQHIPIVLMSANKDGKQIADVVGADAFIAKPFDIAELIATVSKKY